MTLGRKIFYDEFIIDVRNFDGKNKNEEVIGVLRRLITRIGYMLVTLIGVSIIAFALVRIAAGNPAELMLPEDATAEEIQLMEEHVVVFVNLKIMKHIINVLFNAQEIII